MPIIRSGYRIVGRSPAVSAMERASHILSVAKQHVPQLIIDGARVDMPKWRDLVRNNIADLDSREQPLDHEIMRNYFPELVEQAECIHGNWAAAVRDYHNSKKIEAEKITLTPHGRTNRRERVNNDILLLDNMGQDLSLTAMLRTNSRLVQDGIDVCGTWRKAVEAAGLDYSTYGPYGKWSDKDFLEKGHELMKEESFDLVLLFNKDIEFAKAVIERFKHWKEYKAAVKNYVPEPSEDASDEPVGTEQEPEA